MVFVFRQENSKNQRVIIYFNQLAVIFINNFTPYESI